MIPVRVRVLRRTELHGGTLVLLPGAEAELHLGLALHLVRNGMAEPADEDSRDWLCIAWWLQDAIPAQHCGTRARRRAARERRGALAQRSGRAATQVSPEP